MFYKYIYLTSLTMLTFLSCFQVTCSELGDTCRYMPCIQPWTECRADRGGHRCLCVYGRIEYNGECGNYNTVVLMLTRRRRRRGVLMLTRRRRRRGNIKTTMHDHCFLFGVISISHNYVLESGYFTLYNAKPAF